MTVRAFARLREILGESEFEREVPEGSTVASVWQALVADRAELEAYSSSISAARNLEYVPMATAVADGDEIAFLPPVSGG